MAVESVNIVLNGVDNASATVDKVNQKLVSSEEKYISKLKEQLIALEQGTLAAERFKLAEMGFSEETINAAIALKQQIEAAKSVAVALDKTGNKVQQTTNSLKDTSEASQKVSGVFSKVFGAIGLSELAAFSDQMGGLSGQVKELEEAGKKGGGAFKALAGAGMAVAAVAAGWKIGDMIADWIYKTEEWNRKTKETIDTIARQADFAAQRARQQFELRMQIASQAATEEQRMTELRAEQANQSERVTAAREKLAQERAAQRAALANDFLGYGTEDNAIAEEAVRIAEQQLQLEVERAAVVNRAIVGPSDDEQELQRRRFVNQETARLQQEIARQRDPDAAERQQQDAAMAAAGIDSAQRMELELLQDTLRTEQELAAERQRNAEREKQEYEARQNALVKTLQAQEDYLAGLRQQNLELTVGAAEAERQRLQAQGFSEEVIQQGQELKNQNELLAARKQLADEQKKIDEDNRRKLADPVAPVQAVQSRLLSRVNTGGGDRVAKASEKTAALTEKIETLQREQLELEKKRGTLQLATLERA